MIKINHRKKLPFKINLGTIVFIMIFIFLVVNIVRYLVKEHVSSYEVTNGQIVEKLKCTGLALRNEEIVYADSSGYLNYYVRDSARVGKNDVIYSVDPNGEIMDYISKNFSSEDSLDNSSYNEIKSDISTFNTGFSMMDFSDVYNFKYQINNDVVELTNTAFMKKLQQSLKESGLNNSLVKKYSPVSGIVSYYLDEFEGKATSTVTSEDFNIGKYNRKNLKTDNAVQAGEPVYKITVGEDWHIVISIDKNRYSSLQQKSFAYVNILKDDLTIPATVRTYQNSKGEYLADLRINRYMIRYINERYLDIEITLTSKKGLKIPRTALVEKECYKVPIQYITDGGGIYGKITLLSYDKNGDLIKKEFHPSIYRIDYDEASLPTYCYINPNDIPSGSILVSNNNTQFTPTETKPITGVYNMNRGYATYKPITIIETNEDFVIAEPGQESSISAYDFIVLNSKTVEEDQLVS